MKPNQIPPLEFFAGLREQVFQPCTVVYECMTPAELQADFVEHRTAKGPTTIHTNKVLREWFKIRVTVEELTTYPEDRYPNGPTEVQLKKDNEGRKALLTGLRKRFREYMERWWAIRPAK